MGDWLLEGKIKKIMTPTIMHSGSRILRDRILPDFEKIQFHLTECKHYESQFGNYHIFTSLRHPARIWESFKRRAAKRTSPRYPYNQETYDWQWREMIDRISKLDKVHYLTVDGDDDLRNKQIDEFEDVLKVKLSRDFTVEPNPNFCGTWDTKVADLDPVNQEYVDFYYSIADR